MLYNYSINYAGILNQTDSDMTQLRARVKSYTCRIVQFRSCARDFIFAFDVSDCCYACRVVVLADSRLEFSSLIVSVIRLLRFRCEINIIWSICERKLFRVFLICTDQCSSLITNTSLLGICWLRLAPLSRQKSITQKGGSRQAPLQFNRVSLIVDCKYSLYRNSMNMILHYASPTCRM